MTAGYEGMLTRKPTNPNAASRFGPPDAGETILTLYTDWGNTARREEWSRRISLLQ